MRKVGEKRSRNESVSDVVRVVSLGGDHTISMFFLSFLFLFACAWVLGGEFGVCNWGWLEERTWRERKEEYFEERANKLNSLTNPPSPA